MVIFPNCKINLGLNIIGKRSDGYHNLESVFYPILIKDIIEVISGESFQFIKSGLEIPGSDADNSCVKAYYILKKHFSDLPAIKLYLHKHIPSGAGLGGGSADGAFTLKLLNDKFHLNLSTKQLIDFCLEIGSDCPFFILNKPSFVCGRGELIEEFPLDLSGYSFAFVHPAIHINTAWAFSKIKPAVPLKSIREILKEPVLQWKHELINDFEIPVSNEYPVLKDIKSALYQYGALYAGMSGSGSSFYGIFEKNAVPSFSFDKNFRIDIIK
ncbi:MAG: 4-(cytidine 5'-diphospho)-2-C-methyl-D-erythritol kinase [Bacteroidetes bacterium]|nr:4-(cytidine 5'-diphospho)-2-C-methyl-D-erythritol kinase [Bacteroidota bacterium]